MIKSERWTSKYLNKNKLNLLQKVDKDTLSLKNEITMLYQSHRGHADLAVLILYSVWKLTPCTHMYTNSRPHINSCN